MTDRILPNSLDAEKAIIGSIIIDESSLIYSSSLDILDFYSQEHQKIFKAILELFNNREKIDLVTLADKIGKDLVKMGGTGYLMEFSEELPSSANVKEYVNIVKEKSRLRKLIEVSSRILNNSYEQKIDSRQIITENFSDLTEAISDDGSKILYKNFTEHRTKLMKERSKKGVVYHPKTPWSGFNEMLLYGFSPGLVFIAGRPRMGKTEVKLNLIDHWLRNGCGVYDWSPEMGVDREIDRLDMIALPDVKSIELYRASEINVETKRRLKERWKFYDSSNYWFDNRKNCSFSDISMQVDLLKKVNNNLKVVCIDMLRQLSDISRAGRYLRETYKMVIEEIFKKGHEQGVCYVCIHHLNREDARKGKQPRIENMQETSDAEGIADLILFCHRPFVYDSGETDLTTHLIMAKQRDWGKFDNRHISLSLEGDHKFIEVENDEPADGLPF